MAVASLRCQTWRGANVLRGAALPRLDSVSKSKTCDGRLKRCSCRAHVPVVFPAIRAGVYIQQGVMWQIGSLSLQWEDNELHLCFPAQDFPCGVFLFFFFQMWIFKIKLWNWNIVSTKSGCWDLPWTLNNITILYKNGTWLLRDKQKYILRSNRVMRKNCSVLSLGFYFSYIDFFKERFFKSGI